MSVPRRNCSSLYLVIIIPVILLPIISHEVKGEDNNGVDNNGGYFGQIRSFLGELGEIATQVASGVDQLSRQIRKVEEFMDATVDEDCYFHCPPGTMSRRRKGHVPSTNGCGSYGLEEYLKDKYLPLEDFIDCCNSHDLCYETCGQDRDECDLRFKKCLYAKCRSIQDSVSKLKFKGCQAGAKLLYTGTTAMGCKPYLEAQEGACECVSVGCNNDKWEL